MCYLSRMKPDSVFQVAYPAFSEEKVSGGNLHLFLYGIFHLRVVTKPTRPMKYGHFLVWKANAVKSEIVARPIFFIFFSLTRLRGGICLNIGSNYKLSVSLATELGCTGTYFMDSFFSFQLEKIHK